MDKLVHFSDVQYVNFNLLMAIHANVQRDPIAAAYQFHLSRQQADKLAVVSLGDLESLAANMRNECLFAPRANLEQLLEAPPGLTIVLSAVSSAPQDKAARTLVERRAYRAAQ
ncbi:hypothetical protein [Duganella vulcania]|uniref:Uncharacterized protein n=1 Tax=Duganella vulcania TaxID=2692166 RepID=A0A845GNT1_9BURK|nr:hypothetical protein [Duganella vulcania]MYM95934.1 hypothetical protein [Duganella vulcania]